MHRGLALLNVVVIASACGRLAFDPSPDAAPSGIDAAQVVDCTMLPDSSACDDNNICTPVSTCQAGACVPEAAITDCTVANSSNEFSGIQGGGNWWYGTWESNADPQYDPGADFIPGMWTGSVWQQASGGTYPFIAAWGAHPAFPGIVAVRRWISDVSGPALLDLNTSKSDLDCGDGVEARILVEGTQVWSRVIAFDDGPDLLESVPVTLAVGTRVDALLASGPNDSCDSTDFLFTIVSRP